MSGLKKVRALSPVWQGDIDDHVIAMAWSHQENYLAAAAVSGAIKVFDSENGQVVYHFDGHDFGTTSLSWSSDGAILSSTGQDGKIRWWDILRGEELINTDAGAKWGEQLVWSPEGDILASCAGKVLRFWDNAGQMINSFDDHSSTIADIAWHPKENVLALCAYNGIMLRWPNQPERVERLEWKGSSLVLAWSPNGKFLATGDQDSTVHFWIISAKKDLQMWGFPTKVRELAWDCSSRYLATGGSPVITIWDCSGKGPAGRKPIPLKEHLNFISALAYQNYGTKLASADQDGCLFLWQPVKKRSPEAQAQLESAVSQLIWSPQDNVLAVGTANGQVQVFGLRD